MRRIRERWELASHDFEHMALGTTHAKSTGRGASKVMKLSKILVATDFSNGARAAIDQGVRLALADDAELILTHVCGALPTFPSEAEEATVALKQLAELQELRRARGAEQLEELATELRDKGVRLHTSLRQGDAAREIAEVAAQRDVELVITGARGGTEGNLFIIGSVAEGVVRRVSTNVLVARGEDEQAGAGSGAEYRRVLVATDLTEASRAVTRMALAFASPDGEIELLHVVDWGDHNPPVHGAFGSPAVDFKKLWRAAIEEADKELTKLKHRLGEEAPNVRSTVLEGLTAAEILKRIREGGHDLLVVGKRVDAPSQHERVGERLVRRAPCSVLAARRVPGELHSVPD
jgi:nucleotide-binding universal stress UspA family protein